MSTHRNSHRLLGQQRLLTLVRSLRARIEDAIAQGEVFLPRRAASPSRLEGHSGLHAQPSQQELAAAPRDEWFGNEVADLFVGPELVAAKTLEEVRAILGPDCRRCKLCEGRTHIVFGVGNPQADVMFVGEGPGRDEDLQGEPFVGRAGQLLTDIITRGMKMRREDVYIANVVKCRPPDNRNPEPDEVAACLPFLRRQIELVKPRVLIALGKVAAQALLGVKTPITQLRGRWHRVQGIPLMATFHPAYLLRNPADKRLAWEDIKQVLKELEKPA